MNETVSPFFLAPDKALAKMFRGKIQELEAPLLLLASSLREAYVKRVKIKPDNRWVADLLIAKIQVRIKTLKSDIKRFSFYELKAKGKVNSKTTIDVEAVKRVRPETFLGEPKKRFNSNNNSRLIYLCPLHSETTPSFVWYTKNKSWYCFGCGQGSDVIGLFMKLYKTTFPVACRELMRLV